MHRTVWDALSRARAGGGHGARRRPGSHRLARRPRCTRFPAERFRRPSSGSWPPSSTCSRGPMAPRWWTPCWRSGWPAAAAPARRDSVRGRLRLQPVRRLPAQQRGGHRDPGEHARRPDLPGQRGAGRQRVRHPAPARHQRLRVVGRDRAEHRDADRRRDLQRHVDDPRREAGVGVGHVGHRQRHQRQERHARADPEQHERQRARPEGRTSRRPASRSPRARARSSTARRPASAAARPAPASARPGRATSRPS